MNTNFKQSINWKKFWKFTIVFLIISCIIYYISILTGKTIPFENIYLIPIIWILFIVMLLLATYSNYLREKDKL